MIGVIPAAGLGTRLLPLTKCVPKPLLPVRGKPAVHWVLEEAASAGIRDVIVVINPGQPLLRNYLSPVAKDHPLFGHPGLEELERLLGTVNITFVEQPVPLGLGHAILRCSSLLGKEPFAVLLADNVLPEGCPLLGDLMAAHESHGKSCIPLRTVYRLEAGDYVFDAEKLPNGLYAVHDVVRSSTAGNGEPRFRGMGRSVLTAEVFDYLPKEFSQQRELTTLPYLLGLARAGRLLGIRVDPNVPLVHLGECGAPEPEKEQ